MLAIGTEIVYKSTGHKGRINKILRSYSPIQYGIYWYGGKEGQEHAGRVAEKGIPNFWQAAENITN